ncbi:hypothetical protein ElyMa_006050200 [Elysia marginata]|uniref:Uncharacterized protein n=1 Tax=Elysia marginata TaxID=1093978 RepID=A0AAV4GMR4_9GAST|nr:hypothetical protein ElyMa_006050200 [Elysia marginata]
MIFKKNSLQNKWDEYRLELNRQYGLHQLDRRCQTTIFRLRAGHYRLRYHMKRVKETNLCPFGIERRQKRLNSHVPQNCQRYDRPPTVHRDGGCGHDPQAGPLHKLERNTAFIAEDRNYSFIPKPSENTKSVKKNN